MGKCAEVDLDRTQTARVADAFDALAERHGGREPAARQLGWAVNVFQRYGRRLGASSITVATLARLASALATTGEDILAGRGPKPARPLETQVTCRASARGRRGA